MSFDPQSPCPNEHIVSTDWVKHGLSLKVTCKPAEGEEEILAERVLIPEQMDDFQDYASSYIHLILTEHKNDLLRAEIERLQEADDA